MSGQGDSNLDDVANAANSSHMQASWEDAQFSMQYEKLMFRHNLRDTVNLWRLAMMG